MVVLLFIAQSSISHPLDLPPPIVVTGPSHPPNRKFRADLAKAPSSKGKHKSPNEASAVKEDVPRMMTEADALRRAALGSRNAIPFLCVNLIISKSVYK